MNARQKTILGITGLGRKLWRTYVFVDEWDVAAPPEAVFDALSDGRTYPEWWTPVYIAVEAEGPPVVGHSSKQHFKGRLPYHLHTESTTVAIDRPHTVTGEVTGDLAGRGTWTVTPAGEGSHVRFDWEVFADRKLLKALTPVLRPLFRWNHNWAIQRAMAGLEPYAQRQAADGSLEQRERREDRVEAG
ncbi:MAG: SRPBCC family protein [Solirubrobacterales bacterium]